MYMLRFSYFVILLSQHAFCVAEPAWIDIEKHTPKPKLVKRPAQSLEANSTYSSDTNPGSYNYFTAVATYGSESYKSAVYANTTYRSVCPTAPRKDASDCYQTCRNMVSKCSSARDNWSSSNVAYQSSMNAKYRPGNSSVVKVVTSTHPGPVSTYWSYKTSWLLSVTTINMSYEAAQLGDIFIPTTIQTTVNGKPTTVTTDVTAPAISIRTLSQAYAVDGISSVLSVNNPEEYVVTSTMFYSWPFAKPSPVCSPNTWTDCSYSEDCNKCTISGGTVRLLYFPVSNTASSQNMTTARSPQTSGALETAVYDNTTLTSGSVYISFNTAYANNACGKQVGNRYPGAILPVDPKDLSSVNMMWGRMYSTNDLDPFHSSPYLIASSFNLADLNWPVPASAYMAQPKCQNGPFQTCTIILDDYNPLLKAPPEVRGLDPAWKSCALDWEGLYDPPHALTPASVAASATMVEGMSTYTSAAPHSTITTPAAQTEEFTVITASPASTSLSSRPTSSANADSAETGSLSESESQVQVSRSTSEDVGTSQDPQSRSNTAVAVPPSESVLVGFSTASEVQHTVFSIPTVVVADPSTIDNVHSESSMMAVSTSSSSPVEAVQSGTAETSSTAKLGTAVMDTTGGADVIFDSSTVANGQSSTAQSGSGPTIFIGSESGTYISQTLQSLPAAPSMPPSPEQSRLSNAAPDPQTNLLAIVGTQTITAGGPAQTIAGQSISLGVSDMIIGTSVIALKAIPSAWETSLGIGSELGLGLTLLANTNRLPPSSGHSPQLSSASDTSVSTLNPTVPRVVFSFGTHTYTAIQTAGPAEAVIGNTTLSVGGSAIRLDGGTVSLASVGLVKQTDTPTVSDVSSTETWQNRTSTLWVKGTTSAAHSDQPAMPGPTTSRSTTTSSGVQIAPVPWMFLICAILTLVLDFWRPAG